jgi:hypothetical protein
MQGMHRKTAPKVKSGRVQKKNRWAETTRLDSIPLVERERPGDGYRHLLKVRDIEAFIGLLPEWDELSRGLDRIVLAAGEDGMGYHELGTVAICAWEKDLWWEDTIPSFIEEHRSLLDRLGVVREQLGERWVCKWNEPQARAFQLAHVLVHELGHHHDRMTTRSQRAPARGEPYAEEYARIHEDALWDACAGRLGT